MTEDYIYDILMKSIPHVLRDSKVYQSLLRAYAAMIFMTYEAVNRATRNVFIDTAVEMIEVHARDIGLTLNNMPLQDARETIMAAWWSVGDVVQEKDIINVVNAYTNGGMKIKGVEDKPGHYVFEFTSIYGIPPQLKALEKVLKRMIGAEYTWEWLYKYITWDEFDAYNKTWDEWDALGLTWDEFEVYKEG